MYIDDNFQFNTFLISVGFGVILSVIFDVFKSLQTVILKLKKYLVFLDVFYCIIATILSFLFFLSINYGSVRIYLIIGIIVGFIIWHLSFSTFFVNFSVLIIDYFKLILNVTANIFVMPIKILLMPFRKILVKLICKSEKYFEFLRNKLKIHLKSK